jgi:hypothetical protein
VVKPSDNSFTIFNSGTSQKLNEFRKGQSAKVKALNAHFPLKKERNINSVKLIAKQEKLLIFTSFVFAKRDPQTIRINTT